MNDWVNKNCHPSQLVISHGTFTDEFTCSPISSFMWLLCRDIHPPPEARGQLRVCVDGSLSIFPSYPYFEVLVENSQFRVPVTNCSGITSSPLLHTRSQTQCVCVTARAIDSQLIPMETLFSDIGPSLTHLMFGRTFSSTQITSESLDEIAYNCPGLKFLCLKRCVHALDNLSGLASIAERCQQLEGLNVQSATGVYVENQSAVFDILIQIRKLSHLAVDLFNLPVDGQRSLGTLENILSLEVEIYGGNNTNDNLSALGQLIPANLKVLLIKFTSYDEFCQIDRGLRSLLCSLPNLKCLSLRSFLRTIAIPADRMCYRSIEKMHLEMSELNFSKDFIDALVSGGHLTHFYLSAYHTSTDALNRLIQAPSMKCFHVRLRSLHKLEMSRKREFTTKITDSARAQGIPQSSIKALSKKRSVMSNVHPDLRPLMAIH